MDSIKMNPWPRWLGSVVLAATVGLGGCSDGSDGAPGVQGAPGINPIVKSAIPDTVVAEINSATVAADGSLTVNFTIEDDLGNGFVGLTGSQIRFTVAQLIPAGADGDGEPSKWQSYINKTEKAPTDPLKGPGTLDQFQANSETASGTSAADADGFTDNGDGSYSYTLAANLKTAAAPALAYNAARTHRVAFQLSGGMPATNAVYDWRPDGDTANMETRNVVSETACNSCHGELALHGGSRVETGLCVTCHNPGTTDANSGNTLDFKVMVHKIHRGSRLPSVIGDDPYKIWGYKDGEHDWSNVVFPQDIRNCTVCHDEDNISTPEASNWRMVPTIEACGSCHDDVNFATGAGHLVGPKNNTECAGCHDDSGVGLSTKSKHLDVVTSNAVLATKLTAVPEEVRVNTPAAGDIEVDIRLTLDGVAVTSLDNTTGQGGVIGKYKYGTDNGAVAINWDNGEGYQVNHQEVQLNSCTAVVGDDGLFTCAKTGILAGITAADVITVTTVDLFLCVDGVSLINCLPDVSGNPTVDQVPVPPTFAFFNGDGTAAAAGVGYDKIGADIDSCRSCHADNEFHHGASELGQCKTCHNATRSSGSRTVGDLKRHVHRYHSGLDEDELDVADIPQDLFPNKVDNCNACHASGQFDLPIQQNNRPSKAAIGANDGDPTVYISPTAVACGSCHIPTKLGYIDPMTAGLINPLSDTVKDNLAVGKEATLGIQAPAPMTAKETEVVNHMLLNGAVFKGADEAEATGKEACSVCHAIGREFAVDTVHTLK